MALRSDYKGIKKLAAGLKWKRPGILAVDDTALAKVFFPRSEQAVLGAKNLANLEYREMTNNSTFTESNGVYTIANNNGTSQYPSMKIYKTSALGAFPAGKYTLSVNIVSFTNNTAVLAFRNASDNAVLSTKPLSVGKMSITYESAVPFTIGFLLRLGSTADAEIQFSEFMLALDNDLTYAPYAMTNKELTEKVQGIINAATNAADFDTFKTALGEITPVTRSIRVTPETREEITEPEEEPATKTIKKSTKKSTAAADTEKEGE